MENKNRRKDRVLGLLAAALLLGCLLLYTDGYLIFLENAKNIITIGVFSDSYWEVQNGYSYQILEDAIDLFEKDHPGVKVEYVSGILKEDYSEWLSEQLLSGRGPDLFFILQEDFHGFAEIGALKDLTSLIQQDGDFKEERFYTSAFEYGKYNGIPYSLPFECAPKLMFVNQTILNKEGLNIPKEDWTWEKFYDICKKVTKDTDNNGMIDQFGVLNYTWEEAFESNGVALFDQRGTKCYLSDERVEPALTFIENLNGLNSGYTATTRDFDLGNVVFWPMSFSEYRAYKPYPLSIKKYSSFEWDCIPMPRGPSGENVSTLDTLRIAMNASTKNTRYAWDFMKILTQNTGIQSEIFDYSEGVSVLKEVTESDEARECLMEGLGDSSHLSLEILGDAVEHAVIVPRFRKYEEAVLEVDKAVKAIIESNSNIRMEQIIWNRKINKFLEK